MLWYSSCRWKSVDMWLLAVFPKDLKIPEQISGICGGKSQNCVSFSSCCKHSLSGVFVQMQAGMALPQTRAGSVCAGGDTADRSPELLDGYCWKSVFTLMVTDLFSVCYFPLFTRLLLQLCLTSPFLLISLTVFFCLVQVGLQKGPKVTECKTWKLASRVRLLLLQPLETDFIFFSSVTWGLFIIQLLKNEWAMFSLSIHEWSAVSDWGATPC